MAEKEVRKLAAVMFTDIQGYTAFVQADEAAALKKVATHRKFLEQYTAEFNGKVIAFYGDGSLSIYESALDAVHCGIAMQKAYQGDHPIPVRIGIHVGDIVFRDETVYGDGVNIASRLQTSGIPGSVYISDRVQAELANHPEIKTKFIGKKNLKNVSSPVGVFVITNDGLAVPSAFTKMPHPKKWLRYVPLVILAVIAWLFINRPAKGSLFGESFTEAFISVPAFTNNTGVDSLDHIAQMAAHWITKELSSIPKANVVSYETGSDMIELAGVSLASAKGRRKFASLTGAVNIVEASYTRIGAKQDTLLMIGYIKSLATGKILQTLEDVRCKSTNPMDCIEAMSSKVKGYWVSRGDKPLTPPNYEAYRAYLSARSAWQSREKEFVFEQLKKAIRLDSGFIDPYFLMLDFFFNEDRNQEAHDTLVSIRRKFPDLNPRQANMLQYHTADVEGRNEEAYRLFLHEYRENPKDLFTNTSAMVMAMLYRNKPREALQFFADIPYDSIQTDGCTYCGARLEIGMWAALDADSMSLADKLAPKIANALYTRKSYGTLIMYYVVKNDTTRINQLITTAAAHADLDRDWRYLPYLAGRLFLSRGNRTLSGVFAKKAIEVYSKKGTGVVGPPEHRFLGKSYYLDQQYDKALSHLKAVRANNPESVVILAELGLVYARQGNKEEVRKIISKLEEMRKPYDYGEPEYYQGRLYAILGEKARATDLFRTALSKGMKYELWVTFSHDPDQMDLIDYPEYRKLMEDFK